MKKLTIFYLANCPYCKNARRAYAELCAEEPAFAAVPVDWIEESEQSALADTYDYYRVPSAFLGKDKLFEARPLESYEECRENMRRALAAAV